MSASGSTTAWFLAPPRACTRLPRSLPCAYNDAATGVEPTNDSACTRGSSSSASTVPRSPLTTLNTPSGRPAPASSCARCSAAEGTFSEGLSTKRSEEHTSELQSRENLVCRLLLEKKKDTQISTVSRPEN